MRDWPIPSSVAHLCCFLGTASYYRRFITGFVTIAAPLNDLTGKSAKFIRTEECQAAFEKLREALCNGEHKRVRSMVLIPKRTPNQLSV